MIYPGTVVWRNRACHSHNIDYGKSIVLSWHTSRVEIHDSVRVRALVACHSGTIGASPGRMWKVTQNARNGLWYVHRGREYWRRDGKVQAFHDRALAERIMAVLNAVKLT